LAQNVKKENEQYGDFKIREFNKSHDRFLIIDSSEVFHSITESIKTNTDKHNEFLKELGMPLI